MPEWITIKGRPLRVFEHPELGLCAWDNGGAQSVGSTYDQGQQPSSALCRLLAEQEQATSSEDSILSAELASDGWYWRLVRSS